MSLILDSRARIPGKSSTRSFISFHCFSSFVSFPRSMDPSITEVGSSSINAFSLGFLDRDRLGGTRGLISHISALASSKEVFSRKGDSAGSGFGFICCFRLLFSCVTYWIKKKKKKGTHNLRKLRPKMLLRGCSITLYISPTSTVLKRCSYTFINTRWNNSY